MDTSVSVIIPTYNYGNFIQSAINSALRQRVSDLEVIVVDDGSTDRTAEILCPYRNRTKYIYQKNQGLSAARNTGIANSSGKLIQFLDADDMLGPNSLGLQCQHLDRHPEVHIAVCRNRLFEGTTPDGRPVPFGSWKLFRENLDLHLCYFNIAPPHAFLSRREAIIETGWFDTQLRACEDYDFWLRAAVRGFVPVYNPSGLVYYRRHQKSMSANLLNQHFHDSILHRRLSALLDQHPEYPVGRRLEGLMAFSSGALITAARLHGHQLKGTQDLLELVLKRTQEAREIALSEKSDWNILMKLYCLRIFSLLERTCFRDSTTVRTIHDNLDAILAGVKAPKSDIGILCDACLSALSESERYFWERWELRRLSFKYFTTRFLAFGKSLVAQGHADEQSMSR
jgi:glycosyltransferase involved in cell wall biosynthesis